MVQHGLGICARSFSRTSETRAPGGRKTRLHSQTPNSNHKTPSKGSTNEIKMRIERKIELYSESRLQAITGESV